MGFKLLYFILPESHADQIKSIKELGGILVDHKVTYLINLKNITLPLNPHIQLYSASEPSQDLLNLAYESGIYSRFRSDPHLTKDQFKNIYKTWMTNSVNHTVAQEVLVISENNNLLGMVTVGEKNHRGDIGLLAVSASARGKNIGTQLVQAAQYYFKQKNYEFSQVVTQQTNIAACKLYEKCGYHQEKLEYFFHIWV